MSTTKIVLLVLGLVIMTPVTIAVIGSMTAGVTAGVITQKQEQVGYERKAATELAQRKEAEEKLHKLQVEYEAALKKEAELKTRNVD